MIWNVRTDDTILRPEMELDMPCAANNIMFLNELIIFFCFKKLKGFYVNFCANIFYIKFFLKKDQKKKQKKNNKNKFKKYIKFN